MSVDFVEAKFAEGFFLRVEEAWEVPVGDRSRFDLTFLGSLGELESVPLSSVGCLPLSDVFRVACALNPGTCLILLAEAEEKKSVLFSPSGCLRFGAMLV